MIKGINIENFRGIESLEMSDMKRITVISGRNNAGKSTILEGLFLLMDHIAPDSFLKLSNFRNQIVNGIASIWEPLFFQMDNGKLIKLGIRNDNDVDALLTYQKDDNYLPVNVNGISDDVLARFRTMTKANYALLFNYLEDEYREEGHYSYSGDSFLREIKTNLPGNEIRTMISTRYINAALARANDYVLDGIGKLEIEGKKDSIVMILQELDPSIEDILTLSLQGIAQLYIRVRGKLIPLQYAGDGVMKLLSICLAIIEKKDGLLLIDEIETGFHYSMYERLWKIIDRISAENHCQIIATTHSYELISAACESIQTPDDFGYYRLDRSEGKAKVFRYSHSMLCDALKAEMEVR